MDKQIRVPALGRNVHLGQLYNARDGTFISGNLLFRATQVEGTMEKSAVVTDKTPGAQVQFYSAATTKERAKSLDIEASISVSVLCGMFTAKGLGKYLDRSEDKSEETTFSGVARVRTSTATVINSNHLKMEFTAKELLAMGATHVVTAIDYGATAVATFSEKSHTRDSNTDVKGKFHLGILEGVKALVSITAEAEVDSKTREALKDYSLDVSWYADFHSEKEPATPVEMLSALQKSSTLAGNGICQEVTLAPLTWYASGINLANSLAELDDVELANIQAVFDDMRDLLQARNQLVSQAQTLEAYFPAFESHCRAETVVVSTKLLRLQEEFANYVKLFRSAKRPKGIMDGQKASLLQFHDELRADKRRWSALVDAHDLAKQEQFPLVSLDGFKKFSTGNEDSSVVLVIIPELATSIDLFSFYKLTAGRVRDWKKGVSQTCAFVSIYAESGIVLEELLTLKNSEDGNFEVTVLSAIDEGAPICLSLLKGEAGMQRRFIWTSECNFIRNDSENWTYTGEVLNGLPHGSGQKVYSNATESYVGNWKCGIREGQGTLRTSFGETNGVFIDGYHDQNNVIAHCLDYNAQNELVRCRTVTLRRFDDVRSHLHRLFTQLGWTTSQKRMIQVGDSQTLFVRGRFSASDSYPTPWIFLVIFT